MTACLVLLFWVFLSSARGGVAASRFTVADLGTLSGDGSEASGINNKGQVAGTTYHTMVSLSPSATATTQAFAPLRAFLWQGHQMTALSAPDVLCSASGLNDRGQVVGSATFGRASHAFLWQDGTLQDLGTLPGTKSEAMFGDHGEARGVNNGGAVVGYCGVLEVNARAWVWRESVMSPLPLSPGYSVSVARGINAAGMIVGAVQKGKGIDHAVLWQNGKMKDIGTLGGSESYAWAINDRSQIVGNANTRDEAQHAFLWQAGRMTDIGMLAGFSQGWAFALNNQGQVVGQAGTGTIDATGFAVTHACLWEHGKWVDLNARVPHGSGWKLTVANGINDRGQIVGVGIIGGQRHAFLLTPK